MILSVSRRTDIPAFYSEWFLNRLKEGFVHVRNPFNAGQVSRIPLNNEVVDCIVFWSKDPLPLMNRLNEIGDYCCYFQFTITPYDRDVETNIRNKTDIVDTFVSLSRMIGKERVILRYDPILLTDRYTMDFHKQSFARLMDRLEGFTERVVVSFLDEYGKTKRNMKPIKIKSMATGEMLELGGFISETARSRGAYVQSCAEGIDLESIGIGHGKCIDGDLIARLVGKSGYRFRNPGKDSTREHCMCDKSIDIGQYDTCLHGCAYCYANSSRQLACANFGKHDAASPILSGSFDPSRVTDRKDIRSLLEPIPVGQGQITMRLD